MIKDIIKISIGVILITIGLIGGIVPVFQGWIFGIPGLIILSQYFPTIKKLLEKIRKSSKHFKTPKKD